MAKTILVMLDGCRYDTITEVSGYLEHLIAYRQGAKYRLRGELPSESRPIYETILTGLPPYLHGVISNDDYGMSKVPNLFKLCQENGLRTAAAAYHWVSELYNGRHCSVYENRLQLDEPDRLINHGIFYWEDDYPDSHLFADAEFLRTTYNPDFLLIHPMNIDHAGHVHGSDDNHYRWAVGGSTGQIAKLLPLWREQGYQVVITADHGMDERGSHGGTVAEHREVPLYIFSPYYEAGNFTDYEISQLVVAPLICSLLGIKPGPDMVSADELEKTGE